MISDKLTITGNLPHDLGFELLRNVRYNINFNELEMALEANKNEIVTAKSNHDAYMCIHRILQQFGIKLYWDEVNLPKVKLNVWVTGECQDDRIQLCLYFNKNKRITVGNWFYLKSQIISILMHEIIHYYRSLKYGQKKTDFGYICMEDNINNYFSQTEELYAYAYQILFDLNTNNNRSSLLTLYNKRITDKKTLQKLSKILNKVAKIPIFRNNNCKFEAF